MRRSFFFALFIGFLLSVYPADTLGIREKILLHSSPVERIPVKAWNNPAMMYDFANYSLSDIRIGTNSSRMGEAALKQEGNGYTNFGVNADSYVILNEKSKVFGEVRYKNGKRYNAVWNETSDFALLYPYVMGDSIGGDLNMEEYFFAGGYTHRAGKWTFGAKLDYRALIEFRKVDPRPKNVVSDFHGSVGAAYSVRSGYQLGIGLHVRKYDQKGGVTFYNDLGSTSVYHLTGLGMDYIRFAGDKKSATYDGVAFGGSIDLLPVRNKGFFATVAYNCFEFTKHLTDDLPLVQLVEHSFDGEFGYLRKEAINYGIRLDFKHRNRTGTENIFGDPVGSIYPQISEAKQYRNETSRVVLNGVLGNGVAGKQMFIWSAQPYVSLQKLNTTYKSAQRLMEVSSITGGAKGSGSFSFSKSLLGVTAGAAYQANLNAEMELTGMDAKSSRYQALLADFRYLGDSHTDISLGLSWGYALNRKHTLQLNANWTHGLYKHCGSTNQWEATLGFLF